jgi:hypothetical protein
MRLLDAVEVERSHQHKVRPTRPSKRRFGPNRMKSKRDVVQLVRMLPVLFFPQLSLISEKAEIINK